MRPAINCHVSLFHQNLKKCFLIVRGDPEIFIREEGIQTQNFDVDFFFWSNSFYRGISRETKFSRGGGSKFSREGGVLNS